MVKGNDVFIELWGVVSFGIVLRKVDIWVI